MLQFQMFYIHAVSYSTVLMHSTAQFFSLFHIFFQTTFSSTSFFSSLFCLALCCFWLFLPDIRHCAVVFVCVLHYLRFCSGKHLQNNRRPCVNGYILCLEHILSQKIMVHPTAFILIPPPEGGAPMNHQKLHIKQQGRNPSLASYLQIQLIIFIKLYNKVALQAIKPRVSVVGTVWFYRISCVII